MEDASLAIERAIRWGRCGGGAAPRSACHSWHNGQINARDGSVQVSGIDVNSRDARGWTVQFGAPERGHLQVAEAPVQVPGHRCERRGQRLSDAAGARMHICRMGGHGRGHGRQVPGRLSADVGRASLRGRDGPATQDGGAVLYFEGAF